jgi:glucarate dehydratase
MALDTRIEKDFAVIVQVYTDEGIVGVGEGPHDHYKSLIEVQQYMIEKLIKPRLLGEDPFNIERIVADAGMTLRSSHSSIIAHPSLVAAAEMACWDIMGKALRVPVYKLLGGKVRDKVAITAFLAIKSPEEMAKDATAAVEEGIKTIKLKVGLDPQQDVKIVKAVRDAVGDGITLRVDANQAWSVGTAINQCRKLERYDLQYIEQPIPRWDYDGLVRLRRRINIPICICEGLTQLPPLMSLIKREAIDFVSSDAWRMGGLIGFKKLCNICEAEGIPVVTHTPTFGISQAAWLHACISSRAVMYATDLEISKIGVHRTADIITKPFEH